MNKQEAIENFKSDCLLPKNVQNRRDAIDHQQQRNRWAIINKENTGIISIMRIEFGNCIITVWNQGEQPVNHPISEEEYKELERAFFDFK